MCIIIATDKNEKTLRFTLTERGIKEDVDCSEKEYHKIECETFYASLIKWEVGNVVSVYFNLSGVGLSDKLRLTVRKGFQRSLKL